jgi:hypothetical protein
MPVAKFLLFCWIGETTKMMFFAFAGSLSLNRFFYSFPIQSFL